MKFDKHLASEAQQVKQTRKVVPGSIAMQEASHKQKQHMLISLQSKQHHTLPSGEYCLCNGRDAMPCSLCFRLRAATNSQVATAAKIATATAPTAIPVIAPVPIDAAADDGAADVAADVDALADVAFPGHTLLP